MGLRHRYCAAIYYRLKDIISLVQIYCLSFTIVMSSFENHEQIENDSKNEAVPEDASQEERIAWLRKRGVVIEMPNEKTKAGTSSSTGDQGNDPSLLVPVVCVRIPCNDSLPYEEVVVNTTKGSDGDQFVQLLRPYFSSNSVALDDEVLQAAAAKQFGSQALPTIGKKSVEKLAREGSVETFTLSQPYLESGNKGVTVYLDEAGQLKGLPHNRRASALAQLCGFDAVPFAGDVFVGRIHYSSTKGIQNVDFCLNEVDSGAEWMKGVVSNNYQHGIRTNKVGMQENNAPTVHSDPAKNYTWQELQGEDSVEVLFTLPEAISHKEIVVKFASTEVKIHRKGKSSEIFLYLKLKHAIEVDECTWTLSTSNKGVIDITLCKKDGSSTWGDVLERD